MGPGPGPRRHKRAISTPYSVLDHTADIGLEATAPDLKRAFEEAAAGMFSLIVDPAEVALATTRTLTVHGTDDEDLLMSWLNELLYVHEAESLVLSGFSIDAFDPVGAELEATVSGEPYDPAKHLLEIGIKACTFNGLEIHTGPPARVRVYFDV